MKEKFIYQRIIKLLWLLLIYTTGGYAQSSIKIDSRYASVLRYDKPAANWNEALPVGNGRMGGMIYGGVVTEHIQLNEQTLWSGAPGNWNNPEAKKYLPLVREAALRGDYKIADSLSKFMQGPYTESYLPMGDLFINYQGIADSSLYSRELNIDSAINKTIFTDKETVYTRQAFASFPDQVIVMRHSSNKKAAISFTALLNSKLHYSIKKVANNHLVLSGKCPRHVEPAYLWRLTMDQAVQYADEKNGEGMNFEIHLLIKNEGGQIEAGDKTISVQHADAVTFIISAATSYNGYNKSPGLNGKNPSLSANNRLTGAREKSYPQLLQRHVSDYQSLFRRFSIDLGESKNANLTTDARLKKMSDYTDPELVATIVQYGRYILIAGSRPGGQPVNLKGIWNDRLRPEYSSNWCIDHDAQMFYYAVETTNLSAMHQPFLQFIDDLSQNGRKTAAINYGMRGWCAHHNADIWRQSGPVGGWGGGNPHWATWNMSGPWLSNHLYEHYLFTGDKNFLRNKAWPVMKGAAEFCLDWLIKNKKGKLISVPSVSPENTFITEKGDTAQISVNSTSDIALIKELFTNCIKAQNILQSGDSFQQQLKDALAKLLNYAIGSQGQLLEWSNEWRPVDPAHRHLSHLYPVFPGSEISPAVTPSLSIAAKKALALREKTNCSWGFAWKAACWARLGEADSAWQTWQYQLRWVDPKSTSSLNNYGLFPNLFNSDGRDVIMNGNGCATAVMAEMLLQSHTGAIELLPSLPTLFPKGAVKGLKARGGFTIDLQWNNNQLVKVIINSNVGNDCRLRMKAKPEIWQADQKVAVSNMGNDIYSFKTVKDKKYHIRISSGN